jgi:23S rRNA pseudouridine1911/1915/1917 synthase
MPLTDTGWLITPDELKSWILHEDEEVVVINKPGLVLCHPSKSGAWSSLVGACREYFGSDRLHMPSRLDRETSGVVVFARTQELGSLLQRAIQHRQVAKTYLAIVEGRLSEPVTVDQPIGRALDSAVYQKQGVQEGGKSAVTEFSPLEFKAGYTLARVHPLTGRTHQIRVHAAWLGHAVAGDKLYGPDERLFLEFIEQGFSEKLSARLPLPRQALHASELRFAIPGAERVYSAPLAEDLTAFWTNLPPA